MVPLSTLNNWLNEFTRFAPSIKCIVYHGNRPTRHGIWMTQVQKGEFHVLLTTYDFIINRKDTPKLGSIPWEYIGQHPRPHPADRPVLCAALFLTTVSIPLPAACSVHQSLTRGTA